MGADPRGDDFAGDGNFISIEIILTNITNEK